MRAMNFLVAGFFALMAGTLASSPHYYGMALGSSLLCLVYALDGVADRLRGRTP